MHTAKFFVTAAMIAAAFTPAAARAEDTLLWKSSAPAAYLYVHDRFGDRTLPCYATKRRAPDGSTYTRGAECPAPYEAYSDIGIPTGYYSRGEATRVSVNKRTGIITLR